MAKKKAKKKSSKKTKAPTEVLVVASKCKEALKGHGCNVGGDALEGLNGWVHWHIAQAARRAEANGRKTVRAHDFLLM
ncbi:MAG: hypothetical protein H6713_37430 [Myxococcales bacterium]|nr:hypothetical protein [Myxococcales bacterium]MCB9755647.1 hypothetical protein [Myxococcales bacterium]